MSKPNEATATLLKTAAENPAMPIVAMEWIAGLPWTKCIVIFVETPDELTGMGRRKDDD